MTWTRSQAVWLCTEIEKLAPPHGIHVALTGGCLYKLHPMSDIDSRKDVDLVLYRIREHNEMKLRELFVQLLVKLDINRKPYSQRSDWWTSFVIKASFRGRDVDFLVPENQSRRSYADPDHPNMIVQLCIVCRKRTTAGPFEKYCSSPCKRRDETGEF